MAIQNIANNTVNRFSSLFDLYSNRLNGLKDSTFFEIKKKAVAHLQKIGFPDRKDEDWKYTNLNQLLKTKYQYAGNDTVSAEVARGVLKNALTLYFDNGTLVPERSDLDALSEGIEVLTIKDALNNPALKEIVKRELQAVEEEGLSAFSLLSLAFSEGLVIRVKKDTSLSQPIQIINNISGDQEDMMSTSLNLVHVEAGARLNILEHSVSTGGARNYLHTIYNRFIVDENANLGFYKLQEEAIDGQLIHTTEVKQAAGSTFTSLSLDLGGRLVRNNMYVTHLGQQVNTNLYGIYLATGERQHIDNQTFIDHAQPHCLSNELYKGIIDNYSKAVFNGKVIVRPDAQKINAFQQNASLLLSDHASIDSKPQLEIFADDVKCSHGATIGQLDEQALYYLMTRGLAKNVAQSMLQSAFLQEVFSELPDDDLAQVFQDRLIEKL